MNVYLIFISVFCLVLAIYLLSKRILVFVAGVSTIGRVVGHDERTIDDAIAYMPIVEFKDSRGVLHRFTSSAGSFPRHPQQGKTVVIRYLPSTPKNAYVYSFFHMWAAPLVLIVLGLGALATWAQG